MPQLYKVEDIVDKILGLRTNERVGKCWARRFISRIDKLKIAFN